MKVLVFVVLVSSFLLSGCFEKSVELPSDERIVSTVANLYKQVGVATSVEDQRLLGKHYLPGSDSWKVIACVDFILPNQETVKDCNDSFDLLKLDSNKWIINGKVNGVYRWLEVK